MRLAVATSDVPSPSPSRAATMAATASPLPALPGHGLASPSCHPSRPRHFLPAPSIRPPLSRIRFFYALRPLAQPGGLAPCWCCGCCGPALHPTRSDFKAKATRSMASVCRPERDALAQAGVGELSKSGAAGSATTQTEGPAWPGQARPPPAKQRQRTRQGDARPDRLTAPHGQPHGANRRRTNVFTPCENFI